MQITIEDISPVEKRVVFELPWSEVGPRLDRAYDKLRREVRLRGFRPGRAPRPVLEKLYRASVEEDVAQELMELSIGQAIREKQIEPVAPARVDKVELEKGKPFRFSALVEVRSQVEVKDYTGIPLERRPPKVTDEQIDEAVERYRRQLTEFVPVEGRAVAGDNDVLMIETHGRVGEHKIKKTTLTVDLTDETASPVPGLGSRLKGLALGEDNHHEIKYRIADDATPKEIAGKDVALHVYIKEAREKRVPALDDELAKDTGEADTLAELRNKVRDRLLEDDKKRVRVELMSALAKEIVKRNPFPIAPSLVARHAETLASRAKVQLMMMGIEAESIDDAKLVERFREEAEREARASVLLRTIAEKEGLEVTDADVQKRIAEVAAARQENAKKLRAEYEQSGRIHGLRAAILEEKTLDKLLSLAKITDADPDRLIVTPEEARAGSGRLVLTPEEAAHEAESAEKRTKTR
jgi:trigger factor